MDRISLQCPDAIGAALRDRAGCEPLSCFVLRTVCDALGIAWENPKRGRPKVYATEKALREATRERKRAEWLRKRTPRAEGWKRQLLPGMPAEARALPRKDYDRMKRHFRHLNAEAARLGVTIEELLERRRLDGAPRGSFSRQDAARRAQAKSAEVRHENLLARFAAVVPEELRARYAGRERQTMKAWRREARRRGMPFEAFVAALVKAKLERGENARAFYGPDQAKRLASYNAARHERAVARKAAKANASRTRKAPRTIDWAPILALVPEAFRARYPEGRTRELKSAIRWRARHTGVTLEEAAAAMGTRKAAAPRAPVPKNDAAHPWHRAIKATPSSVPTLRKRPTADELAKMPAPTQETTTSRFRNCATCAHAGLFKCRAWPALRAAANFICKHYANDRAAPSAREECEDEDSFF